MAEVRCMCGAQADVWQVDTDRSKSLIDSDSFLECCEELKACQRDGRPEIRKHECPHLNRAIREEMERLAAA